MEFGKLSKILSNNDIVLAIGLVIIVVMMVIPIPAPVMVLIFAVIEVVSGFFSSSNVAHFTHLFGFLIALLYFIIRMGVNPLKIWKDTYKN